MPGAELPEDLTGMTREQVTAWLRDADDDQLTSAVRRFGPERLLTLLFEGWAATVEPRPGRHPGLLAFALTDPDGTVHRHGLQLSEAGARHAADPAEARATVRTTLLRFLRVAGGTQDPRRLVLLRRLTLSGDLVWAVTILGALRQ